MTCITLDTDTAAHLIFVLSQQWSAYGGTVTRQLLEWGIEESVTWTQFRDQLQTLPEDRLRQLIDLAVL